MLRLNDISPEMLTITWMSLVTQCSVMEYMIRTNCSSLSCNNVKTTATFVFCSNITPTAMQTCSFRVQAVLCENVLGSESSEIIVILKGKIVTVSTRMIAITFTRFSLAKTVTVIACVCVCYRRLGLLSAPGC